MKYSVTIGGQTFSVEVEGPAVRVDGHPVSVVRHSAGGPVWRLVVDGRSVEVAASRAGRGSWELAAEGARLTATVLDERAEAIRALTAQAPGRRGPTVVVAPMPGLVLRVLVAPGDVVRAGSGLIVVEAMKMENELKAPADGTVGRVHVSAGARVEKGALLVDLSSR
jgi:pyruvate carboxylase subunit B